jgi:hypothetical protein
MDTDFKPRKNAEGAKAEKQSLHEPQISTDETQILFAIVAEMGSSF